MGISNKNSIRLMVFVLTLAGAGCSKPLVRFNQPPRQNPGLVLPSKVSLQLKSGVGSENESRKEISGKLLSWKDGVLVIESEHKMELPVERIEKLEVMSLGGGMYGLGCFTGGGAVALIGFIVLALIL